MRPVVKVVLSIAGLTAASLFTGFTFLQYLKRRKYRHIKGPKTNGILGFYLGHLIDLKEAFLKGSNFPEETVKWQEQFGSIFKIQIFNNIMVFALEPDAIKEILVDEDFPKADMIYKVISEPFGIRALGEGLFTVTNKMKWKPKRALFNHGFQRNYFPVWVSEFNQQGNILMEKMRSLADGKTLVTLSDEINRFAMDVIANAAFNINTGAISNPNVKLNVLLNNFMNGLKESINDPLMMFKPNRRFEVRKNQKAIRDLRDFARTNIVDRLKQMEDKDYVPKDILSVILSNAQNEQIDLEELVDDFLTFFGAGQETTSNTLAFAVMELGLNPHCLQRARQEIDEIVGSKSEISYEDLNKMEYVNCVFKETLRKYPVAPQIARLVTKEINVNGTVIPKNTYVSVSMYAIGRNPKFYPEPEKFEPERFLKGSKIAQQNTINSYTYFPFSLGPRNCIGLNFAQLEGRLFLVKFIQSFDFRLDQSQSFKAIETLTLKPKDGCQIYLRVRENV